MPVRRSAAHTHMGRAGQAIRWCRCWTRSARTGHAFAAGHDLTAPGGVDEMFGALAAAVGPDRLRLVHANDSATPCGSRSDRHASIGAGHIGAQPFSKIILHPATAGVPVIVETPGAHGKDIALLKGWRDGSGARRARRRWGALCCARAQAVLVLVWLPAR
jgi:hypothetical protein